MTKYIEALTPEQERKVKEYQKQAFDMAYDTMPGDEKQAKAAIVEIYKWCGLKEPKIFFVDGPMAVQKKCNELAGTKGDYYPFAYYGEGGIEGYWTKFYDFFFEVCGIGYKKEEDKRRFETFKTLINNSSFMYQGKEACVISRKPIEAHRNAENRPHKDGGEAFKWADGFGLFFLNGVKVPKWVAKTPAKKITAKQYFTEQNVEVKREIYRKIGAKQFLKMTKAKLVHEKKGNNPYKLYFTDLGLNTPTNFLLMKNPSVKGLWHAETVGLNGELKTIQEALNFRAQRILKKGENWNPAVIV